MIRWIHHTGAVRWSERAKAYQPSRAWDMPIQPSQRRQEEEEDVPHWRVSVFDLEADSFDGKG